MATFQIHEDIENMNSRIFAKKFGSEAEKKIVKKTFGENNIFTVQPANQNGGLKEIKKSKVPVKIVKIGKEQFKKTKIIIEDKTEVSLWVLLLLLIVNDFFGLSNIPGSICSSVGLGFHYGFHCFRNYFNFRI